MRQIFFQRGLIGRVISEGDSLGFLWQREDNYHSAYVHASEIRSKERKLVKEIERSLIIPDIYAREPFQEAIKARLSTIAPD